MEFSNLRVGDVDVGHEIINLEFQFRRLQLILDWILESNPISGPDQETLAGIEDRVISVLKQKYPDAGLEKKVDENGMLFQFELAKGDIIMIARERQIDVDVEVSEGNVTIESHSPLPDDIKDRISAVVTRAGLAALFVPDKDPSA